MAIQVVTELDQAKAILDAATGNAKAELHRCLGGPLDGRLVSAHHSFRVASPAGEAHYRLCERVKWSDESLMSARFWLFTGGTYQSSPEIPDDIPDDLFEFRSGISEIATLRNV